MLLRDSTRSSKSLRSRSVSVSTVRSASIETTRWRRRPGMRSFWGCPESDCSSSGCSAGASSPPSCASVAFLREARRRREGAGGSASPSATSSPAAWAELSSASSVSNSVWGPDTDSASKTWSLPGVSADSRSVWEPVSESADSKSVWGENPSSPGSYWPSGFHSGSVWGKAAWSPVSSPDSRSVWGASGSKVLAAASSRSVMPALATSPGGVSGSVWGMGLGAQQMRRPGQSHAALCGQEVEHVPAHPDPLSMEPSIHRRTSRTRAVCKTRKGVYFPRFRALSHLRFRM